MKKNKSKKKRAPKVFAVLLAVAVLAAAGYKAAEKNGFFIIPPAISGLNATYSDSMVKIDWNPADDVDLYRVYGIENSEPSLMAELKPEVTEFLITSPAPGHSYTFGVTTVRVSESGKEHESIHHTVSLFTPPLPLTFSSVISPEKGTALVKWVPSDGAAGYKVEYALTNDFSDAKEETVSAGTEEYENDSLDEDTTYFFRISSYALDGTKKVFSEPSLPVAVNIMGKTSRFVDPGKPMIALTFDDGPGYNNASRRILDTLEKYGARATFFMVGNNAADNPENLKRKVALGCELGNHTMTHKNYGKNVTAADISDCSEAIYKACGQYPTCFRSPGGNTNDFIRSECRKAGLPLYYWSIDTNDWKYKDGNRLYNYVINHAGDGDIVLMHEIYTTTADGVEKIVPELIRRGYQLVTVSELVNAKTGSSPVPGEQYVTAEKIRNELP